MKIIIDILSAIGTLSFFASLFTLRHMFKKDQLTKKNSYCIVYYNWNYNNHIINSLYYSNILLKHY